MKKYTTITNRSSFPITGYRVSEGNMHRSYCSCGYDVCDVLDECPICGNKKWTTKYDKTKTFTIHLNGLKTIIEESTHYIALVHNDLPATTLEEKVSSINHDLWNCSVPLDKMVEDYPELLTIPELQLVYKIFKDNNLINTSDGWYYAPNRKWQSVSLYAAKCIKEFNGYAPKATEQLIDIIGNYDLVSKSEMIARSRFSIKDIMFNFQNLKPYLQVLMKSTYVFEQLLSNPSKYDQIDDEVGDFIAAYYAEGYVEVLTDLLATLSEYKFTPETKRMFMKWMKDNFQTISYSCTELKDMLTWIKTGSFDNTKEYYMLRNRERFTQYFDTVKYDNAMLDFYQNPADAIIKLAQIK